VPTRLGLPDGFIGDNYLRPVLNLVRNSLELLRHHLDGLVRLTLLQALTTAKNDTQATIDSRFGLACNKLIVFLENDSSLRVSQDGPGNTTLLQLIDRYLTREGAVGLVINVLGGNFEALTEVLASKEEIERRWGDDNLCSM
jgi:hypothetical protein